MAREQAPDTTVTTREKILTTALRLLAERGYTGVSMRDIAAEVGIRASSIYNHFESKDAILDAIVGKFREELVSRAVNDGSGDWDALIREKGPEAVLVDLMLAPVALLADRSLDHIIRVVTKCQYHHEGIRAFLKDEMIGRPLALLVRVLTRMKELSLVRDYPTEFLAGELQGVLVASFYRLSLRTDGFWIEPEETRRAMEMHVEFFWRAARA